MSELATTAASSSSTATAATAISSLQNCSTSPLPHQYDQQQQQPSTILSSQDGSFRLDLTSLNLSATDLATITAAFNQTINSISSTPASTQNATAVVSTPSMPSKSSPSAIKKSPKTRRQRAKHAIIPQDAILLPENVPGNFLNLTVEQFDGMVYDNESALAFAAKCGLINNIRHCPKCEREMALCKFNNSCGYRWVCRRTEDGRRFTCSVRGMRKETILDDRLVGILTMLRIMFHFSKNTSDADIIGRLDIGHVRSAKTILSRLRDMVHGEVVKLSTDAVLTPEELRHHFLTSQGIDTFGFILFWGSRYKPEKSAQDQKSPKLESPTEASSTVEPPPTAMVENESIPNDNAKQVETEAQAESNLIPSFKEEEETSSVPLDTCDLVVKEEEEGLKESSENAAAAVVETQELQNDGTM